MCSTHDLGPGDTFLQKTPISFDVSVRELFFPYSCGGCLVFAEPGGHRDTEYLARLMGQMQVSCASFVPSQLEVFLQVGDTQLVGSFMWACVGLEVRLLGWNFFLQMGGFIFGDA